MSLLIVVVCVPACFSLCGDLRLSIGTWGFSPLSDVPWELWPLFPEAPSVAVISIGVNVSRE